MKGAPMIMQGRQVTRFLRLFDSLLAFCVRDLEVPDLVAPDKDPLEDEDLRKVLRAVWGEEGDLSVIDRYVEANPDKVNRADLREVESWKSGLHRDFIVVREGGNVYFMLGRHAFAVRGLDYEVDDDLDYVPTYVLTLLLPFDGLITYGTSLVFTAVRLDHEEVSALEGMLGECKAAGNIVRTARQFIQAVPLALEEERQLLREALESLGDAPQLGPGTHVGALAGLGTEERSEALSDHACEQRPLPADHYARMFDRVSINCAPKATLREYLASQSLKELRRTAQRFRVKTSGARDGKNQIIRAIMDPSYFNYDEMTGEILLNGDVAAEGLRDCYEAGGRIVVPDSEVTSLDALPQPIEPYLVIFHDRGKFCAQLFQEAMDWLSDARVASIMERTRIVDSIIDYARLVVDFRGVVDAFDVVDEAIDALGFADMSLGREYIVMLIAMRAKVDGIALGFNVAWQDGDTYLMAADLLDGTGAIALDDEGRERVGFVLEDHEGFEPRPVEDLPDTCGGAFEWMEGTPEYRSLLGFLDAHVPDGANDYEYADDALLEVFTCSRFVYDIFIDDALDVLATRGYDPSDDEERERVVRLLQDFYEATPKWQLNGWALTEMEAHEL